MSHPPQSVGLGNEPVRESFPAETHGSVHTHEEEKGAQEESVKGRAVRDIRRHPSFLPSLRRKFEEGIGGFEHELRLRTSILPDLRSL